jgi:hypothetical protein
MRLVVKYHGFGLIVGGNPYNNLTSNNYHMHPALKGVHSTIFFGFKSNCLDHSRAHNQSTRQSIV